MKKSKLILLAAMLFALVLSLSSCGESAVEGGGIYTPFAFLLRVLNDAFNSYALALLVFALMVKVLLLPFAVKQQKGQIKMAKMRPKLMAIEKKYAGRNDQPTLRRKQEEMMALQQEEGYSPLSGCLPLLIQLPIIFILYSIIRNPLTHICGIKADKLAGIWNTANGFTDGVKGFLTKATEVNQIKLISTLKSGTPEAAQALTDAGLTVSDLPNFQIFGGWMDLSRQPNEGWGWLWLIPLLTFVAAVVTMRLTKRLGAGAQMQAQTADQKVSMGIMEWMMPVMSTWISIIVPAALGLYWFYQSLLGLLQMVILAKAMPLPKYTKEELEQMMRELKGKPAARAYASASAGGDRPRSLHHIDDDEDEYPELPPRRTAAPPQNAKPQSGASRIDAAPRKKDDQRPGKKK